MPASVMPANMADTITAKPSRGFGAAAEISTRRRSTLRPKAGAAHAARGGRMVVIPGGAKPAPNDPLRTPRLPRPRVAARWW
jgi:hypothetical protein